MSYCVEITMPNHPLARWETALHGKGFGIPLANLTRERAVELASKLPRCNGWYAYRVRRYL